METTRPSDKGGKGDDTLQFLDQCVKKILKMRRAWDIFFRVLPPNNPGNTYSVILEKGTTSEQLKLNQQEVSRCATSGTDIFVSTDIRNAIRRLEKRADRKSTLRS